MSSLAARTLIFFAAASVLLLEILAGRLLAPYVGVSLETFTAIIGTVLAGIAAGSWWGGRMADRHPPRKLLGPLLIAGGVLAMFAPTTVAVMGPRFRGGEPVGIVVLTSVGFLAPAVVLSAVSPIVVKIRLHSLAETGAVVGKLSAVGTAGALFGTFVTGFVLLAAWPSRPIVLVVGGALVAVGLVFAFTDRATSMASVIGIGSVAAIAGFATVAVPGPCEYETAYVCAQVVEDPQRSGGRSLVLDTVRHSYVDLNDPTYLEFRYIQLIADVIDTQLPSAPVDALYLGGGGFTVPQWLEHQRPESTHTVLELDPVLVEISETRLGLDRGSMDEILVGDARMTIEQATRQSFDVIVGDAFSGSSVPWHLTTTQYLTMIDDRLADGGVYVMNLIDYAPHAFAKSEVATVASLFEEVLVVAPESYLYGDAGGNFIVVASHRALDADALSSVLRSREARSMVIGGAMVTEWYGDALILTDEFAPVDQLVSRPG